MKRRNLKRILKHLALSWNLVWIFLFIPLYFIRLISLLQVRQTPLMKNMIRNFLNNGAKQSEKIIHNFSSYSLTKQEVEAWSYGLDQHIPNYTVHNTINTDLSCFFKIFYMTYLIYQKKPFTNIKTKLCSSCEKYYNKKTPYKYKKVIHSVQRGLISLLSKWSSPSGNHHLYRKVTPSQTAPGIYLRNPINCLNSVFLWTFL